MAQSGQSGQSSSSDMSMNDLKFGDVVTIHCPELHGFLSAAGWHDKRLRVECIRRDVKIPPNLMDCKFEVVGKRQYTALKALKKEMAKERLQREQAARARKTVGNDRKSTVTGSDRKGKPRKSIYQRGVERLSGFAGLGKKEDDGSGGGEKRGSIFGKSTAKVGPEESSTPAPPPPPSARSSVLNIGDPASDELAIEKGRKAIAAESDGKTNTMQGRRRSKVGDAGASRNSSALLARQHAEGAEHAVNEAEFLRSIGHTVHYGEVLQLRHVATGEFITIKKERADQERHCMKVLLQRDGDEGSWFQVAPGFRTKVDGDGVLFGDTILLVSAKFSNSQLHLSAKPEDDSRRFKHMYVLATHEFNASTDGSHLKFRPYGLHPLLVSPEENACLKGGDAVMVRHRATDSVLVYTNDGLCFEYSPQTGSTNQEPSSNALWKVESAQVEWAGMPMRTNTFYRLKHLASLAYLTASHLEKTNRMVNEGIVEEEYSEPEVSRKELTLSFDYSGTHTIWRFHQGRPAKGQAADNAPIPAGSLVFCENGASQWLSEERQASEGATDSLIGKLRDVTLAEFSMDKDALSLDPINDMFVERLLRERGALTQLTQFTQHIGDEVRPIRDMSKTQIRELYEDRSAIIRMVRSSGLRNVLAQHGDGVQRTLERIIVQLQKLEGASVKSNLRSYQALMREQNIITMVVRVLEVVFHEKGLPLWTLELKSLFGFDLLHLCKLAMRFLVLVCRGNREVKDYIIDRGWLALLQDLLGCEIRAAVAISEIYDDNEQQIQRVSEDEVKRYVELLRTDKRPRFLHFLEVICKYKGTPLPRNQNMVVQYLLMDGVMSELLLSASISKANADVPDDDPAARTLVLSGFIDNRVVALDCTEFYSQSDNLMDRDTSLCSTEELALLFYIKMLQLFCTLCLGRNRKACDALLKVSETFSIGYDDLRMVAFHPYMPNILKTACVELLIRLFIDREPHEPLRPVELTRVWRDVDIKHTVTSRRVKVDPFAHCVEKRPEAGFKMMKKQMMAYLTATEGVLDVSKPSQNSTVLALVRLGFTLLNMGLFGSLADSDKMIGSLVDICLDMLDGRKDIGIRADLRFDSGNANTKVVMEVKAAICELLQYAFDMRVNRRLDLCFITFTDAYSSGELTSQTISDGAALALAVTSSMPGGSKFLKDRQSSFPRKKESAWEKFVAVASCGAVRRKPEVVAIAPRASGRATVGGSLPGEEAAQVHAMKGGKMEHDLYNLLFQKPIIGEAVKASEDFDPINIPNMLQILLDLARYDHRLLQASAFSLIERHLSQRAVLARCLMKMQVLVVEEVVKAYYQSQLDVSELRRQRKWLICDDPIRQAQARKVSAAILQRLSTMCIPDTLVTVDNHLNRDSKFGGQPGAANGGSEVASPFAQTSESGFGNLFCFKLDEVNVMRFQVMLFNLGAHDVAVEMLKLPLKRIPGEEGEPDEPEDLSLRDLFQEAYTFLRHFAQHNKDNQRAVFANLDIFRMHMGIKELNVADTISACFQSSMELTSQVPEAVIHSFFQLIVKYGMKARWLRLLIPLVVVEKETELKPVKKNQDVVMRYLFEYEGRVCLLWKDAEGWRRRHKLMHDQEHFKPIGSLLRYHVTCVRLLAACCHGKNPATEVKASGLLSLNEVLTVLMDLGSPQPPPSLEAPDVAPPKTPDYPNSGGYVKGANAAASPNPPTLSANVSTDVIKEEDEEGEAAEKPAPEKEEPAPPPAPAPAPAKPPPQDPHPWDELKAHPGTLRFVKEAYLHFLRTVYIETSDRTVHADRDKRHINSKLMWPRSKTEIDELTVDAADDRENCLFSHLARDIRAAVANEDADCDPNDLTARQYVANAVLPLLQTYFKRGAGHYDRYMAPEEHQDVYNALSDALRDLTTVLPAGSKERAQAQFCLAIIKQEGDEILYEYSGVGPQASHYNEYTHPGERFNARWQEFCKSFAIGHLSIKPSAVFAPDTITGIGERNLVKLLAQPGVVKGSSPPTEYSQIVLQLANLLSDEADRKVGATHQGVFTEELTTRLLRVLRAVVYVFDGSPTTQISDELWNMFEMNKSVMETKRGLIPSTVRSIIGKVQNKFAQCNVAKMAAKSVISANPLIQSEALKLLIVLLDGGNFKVQQMLFDHLTEKNGCLAFFKTMQQMLRTASGEIKEFRKSIRGGRRGSATGKGSMVSKKPQNLRAARSSSITFDSRGNADDPNSLLQSGRLLNALRMMQLLVEGHYHDMQVTFQTQGLYTIESYDMLAELVRFLENLQPGVVDTFQASFDNTSSATPTLVLITIQVCSTLLELIQGPCHNNVLALIRSQFLSVAERLLGACKYQHDVDLLNIERPEHNIVGLRNQLKMVILDIYLALMAIHGLSLKDQHMVVRRMTEIINYQSLMEEAEFIRSTCDVAWAKASASYSATDALSSIFDDADDENSPVVYQKRLTNLQAETLKCLFLTMELDGFDMRASRKDEKQCTAPFCHKRQLCGLYCFGHARFFTPELNNFFKLYTCSVEVKHNNRIQRIHFQLTDECRKKVYDKTWQEKAKVAMYDVPRANPKEKMEGMIDKIVLLLFSLKHSNDLALLKYSVLGLLLEDRVYSRLLSTPFYISFVILIIVTLCYGKTWESWNDNTVPLSIVAVLGWIQVLVSVLSFSLFLIKEATIISFEQRQRAGIEDLERLLKVHESIRWSSQTAHAVLGNYRFWFLVSFVLAAFAGVLGSPFFYTVHLLDFLVHSPAGQEVMQSFRVGGPPLMRTGLVGMLIMFIYAIVGWVCFAEYLDPDIAFMEEFFGREYNKSTDKFCTTLYQCVGMHLTQGLGQVGDFGRVYGDPVNEWFPSMNHVPSFYYQEVPYQARTIFVLSFIIIWGFLLSNIMTGQIVEAFTQIRQRTVESVRDLEERCFICSKDRYAFEQRKGTGEFGFQHHIEHEHNPIHYLYYLDRLMHTDETDYTGIETHVAKLLREKRGKRTDWLPINRALQLERLEQEMEDHTEIENQKQDQTLAAVHTLDSHVRQLDGRLRHIEESGGRWDERLRNLESTSTQILFMLNKLSAASGISRESTLTGEASNKARASRFVSPVMGARSSQGPH